jgi:hypothetical protein
LQKCSQSTTVERWKKKGATIMTYKGVVKGGKQPVRFEGVFDREEK